MGIIATFAWVGKRRRHLEQAIVGLGLADGDAGPLAGERADHDAGLLGGGGELGGPFASSNQTKLPWGAGTFQPDLRQPEHHPLALGDQRVDPLQELGLGSSDAIAAACAIADTPNGSETARSAPASGAGPTAYPTRKPASP